MDDATEHQPGTYTYFCRIHPFMRGAFRVEQQNGPLQTLKAKPEQRLASAAVTETLDKPATVKLEARVKGPKQGASKSAASPSPSARARCGTVNPLAGSRRRDEDKAQFSRAARRKIKAALSKGMPWKVVVTATATDRFGKTSTAKTRFRLVG